MLQPTSAVLGDGGRPEAGSLLFGADLDAATRLHRPETDIVLVRRPLPREVQEEAARRCAFGPVFQLRHELDVEALDGATLASLFAPLGDGPLAEQVRRDVASLGPRWAALTGRRHAKATLALHDTDQCRKLHADYVDLRILCTYHGPGTWLAPEDALDRSAFGGGEEPAIANARICPDPARLVQAQRGDVAFLKGKTWREGARGAVHRSPTIEGTGLRRLLLKLDGMGCGC